MKLACILTCHNRRSVTLRCLAALRRVTLPDGLDLSVYLVDDGSNDGTGAAAVAAYPGLRLLVGNGSLYWNGGMRLGFAAAMADGHDDYLWLNDDTLLDIDALVRLYACREQVGAAAPNIIVGATRDAVTGELTYGGLYNRGRPWAHYYTKLPASETPQRCLTFNGNCVLIAGAAAQVLGNLDPGFVHSIGDWDYGLRAHAAGIGCWVAPGFIGSCSHNLPRPDSPDRARSVRAQLHAVCSPKQLPPGAWFKYVRRHFPMLWPTYFVRPYGGAVLRALRAKLARGAGARPS